MTDNFENLQPITQPPPEPPLELTLAPAKPKKRKKQSVGAAATLVRWMMRNANKRPVSTALIQQGVPGVRSGEIHNLKKLGVIIHVANATYQMAEEFRNATPPGPNTRFITRWIAHERAEATKVAPVRLAPVPKRVLTDNEMLTALEKLTNGKLLNIRQAALVTEWLELTRQIVS